MLEIHMILVSLGIYISTSGARFLGFGFERYLLWF